MTPKEILNLRLVNQQIAHSKFKKPADLVHWMGATQAQDYMGGLWAVGLRTGATAAQIQKAIADRQIVRTWPMRGTLHFIDPQDIRWFLRLSTPRIMSGVAARHRHLNLNKDVLDQARRILAKALKGGKIVGRKDMYKILEEEGIGTATQRGLHILWYLSQNELLVFGPHKGKDATFTLLDEWIPKSKELTREQSLAEFAERYFLSHGPATIQDFCWWSGLRVADAKAGIAAVASKLKEITVEGKTYWLPKKTPALKTKSPSIYMLPPWDEYLVGYKDRTHSVASPHTPKVFAKNGTFSPTVVLDGQIIGTWYRSTKKDKVIIKIKLFEKLSLTAKLALEKEVARYGNFLGMPAVLQ